jgi:hypothetical protein
MKDTAMAEMPRYQCHKKVWALRIKEISGNTLSFFEPVFAPIEVDPKLFLRYTPVPGDYYVVYEDGYKSISPEGPFKEGYTPI